jgi:hypothetical protein
MFDTTVKGTSSVPAHPAGTERRAAEEKGPPGEERKLWGILAEFTTPEVLLAAAAEVRDAGFRHWDAHAPFPVHGLNDAMGIRQTKLPLFVLGGGITGGGLALLMQWWMNAIDYPLIISGKPFFSLPANIPVYFELTVLFSALGAFLGMLAFNLLPEYSHPLFSSERFRRATQDRFFISIEARDPKFDPAKVQAFLECLGSTHVERVEESA